MNVIIVEDEAGAAEHLTAILRDCDGIDIKGVCKSVEESVRWFESNPNPDLGFFDIQLSDGLSFEIFQKTEIVFPVIFTTAFSQYAIDAFRVNSIDYLLKPIKMQEIKAALRKFENNNRKHIIDYVALAREMARLKMTESFTLLVNQKDKLIPIPAADFSYFFLQHGLLHGAAGNRVYAISNMTMDDLQHQLNMGSFFRVNRQCIVNRSAIAEMQNHFQSKLALRLTPPAHETIMVSKARVAAFKHWLSTGIQ